MLQDLAGYVLFAIQVGVRSDGVVRASSTPPCSAPTPTPPPSKLTKPVWLAIIGGSGLLLACVLGAPFGSAIAAVRVGHLPRRRSAQDPRDPGKVALARCAASSPPRAAAMVAARASSRRHRHRRYRAGPALSSTTPNGRTGATCPACACIRRRRARRPPRLRSPTPHRPTRRGPRCWRSRPTPTSPACGSSSCATGSFAETRRARQDQLESGAVAARGRRRRRWSTPRCNPGGTEEPF